MRASRDAACRVRRSQDNEHLERILKIHSGRIGVAEMCRQDFDILTPIG
jgi:hypothetical protein